MDSAPPPKHPVAHSLRRGLALLSASALITIGLAGTAHAVIDESLHANQEPDWNNLHTTEVVEVGVASSGRVLTPADANASNDGDQIVAETEVTSTHDIFSNGPHHLAITLTEPLQQWEWIPD